MGEEGGVLQTGHVTGNGGRDHDSSEEDEEGCPGGTFFGSPIQAVCVVTFAHMVIWLFELLSLKWFHNFLSSPAQSLLPAVRQVWTGRTGRKL